MVDFRALAVFVKVAERRSFAAAAAELGVTPSGISNAISRLEQRLGVRLLARTTRRVALTEDGLAFFERCRHALADLDEAERMLSRARMTPSGRLRVDLPLAFGRIRVVPLLGAFQAEYPELMLAVSFNDRYIDLVEDGVDIAIRMGPLQDSSLIGRRLGVSRFRVFGAPAYFARHGEPRVIDDLSRHNCLAYTSRETRQSRPWRFRENGQPRAVLPRGDLTLTDGAAILEAVRAGYGLAQMPDYYAADVAAAGILRPVLGEFEPDDDQISLVYPPTRHLLPKVRAFIQFMTPRLR